MIDARLATDDLGRQETVCPTCLGPTERADIVTGIGQPNRDDYKTKAGHAAAVSRATSCARCGASFGLPEHIAGHAQCAIQEDEAGAPRMCGTCWSHAVESLSSEDLKTFIDGYPPAAAANRRDAHEYRLQQAREFFEGVRSTGRCNACQRDGVEVHAVSDDGGDTYRMFCTDEVDCRRAGKLEG